MIPGSHCLIVSNFSLFPWRVLNYGSQCPIVTYGTLKKKGLYSVKSGYRVACNAENITSQASSSGGSGIFLWNKVWGLRVPPKVCVFIWRLLRGILPTKIALAKKVGLLDVDCVFCHNYAESDMHLFKDCGALNCFWHASALGLLPCPHTGHTLLDWFSEVSQLLPTNHLELLCMCLWVIWTERNNIIWKNSFFNPSHMASWAFKSLENYQKYHPAIRKNSQRPLSHWETPPSGRLKINVDGSFICEGEHGGIGVIIRDANGQCIASLSRSLTHVSSAIQAEVEACRAGLFIAINQGWDNIILESDCASIVTALSSVGDDFSQIGRIVGDCKEFMGSLRSISIRHIYREANGVAHRLAHIASFSNSDKFWLHETPSIIEDVLFEDLCNCIRGSGFMSSSVQNF
ncbi:hypothetical protein M0R45_009405 [Rubus argutus]|uniref:Uncharacterized protein n=1 Tax=Rubus argutus TaxID=59490 RepID=A0AAW1Y4D0_RUBAR